MMTTDQRIEISDLIHVMLDNAEEKWMNGGNRLVITNESRALDSSIYKSETIGSSIPGHPLVNDDEVKIDEFIALVADMRDSSNHLMCASSHKKTDISGLQRVFYETSALLPAIAKTISYENGNVTEYLGDGVLAFFKVDKEEKNKAIYAAHRASKNIISDTRTILNSIIHERYRLPEISVGVGLAYSKAMITLVGLQGEKHPKAFGECVFRATKLSNGNNLIMADENLKAMWPTSKGGNLSFNKKIMNGVNGFVINRKTNI